MREFVVSTVSTVIIILVSCLIVNCNNIDYKSYDTIVKEQQYSIDSLTGELAKIKLELETAKSALTDKDSLKVENFILKYKINRIKQYDSIVIRNSSQSKYFRGWVRRVIYE